MIVPGKVIALSVSLLALLAVAGSQGVPARNPGVQVQISHSGLNFAGQMALDILEKNLKNGDTIPDQIGKTNVEVGDVDYWFTNMKLTSFTKPSSVVTVNPGSGVTWSLANAGMSISGDWRYQYKLWFVKIKDSGSFTASVSGASASASVSLETLPSGNPTIKMLTCSCNIATSSVHFSGGASWLYNIFKGVIEGELKKQLEKEVCNAAEKTINHDAVLFLATLKTTVAVEKFYVLDYSLIGNPLLISDYLQTAHKGEAYHIADIRSSVPFPAAVIPTPPPQRMITAYVNEYVANTIGYVVHQTNILWYSLTKSDLPDDYQQLLHTTCTSGDCFGTYFPEAADLYPDSEVELNMTISSPPTLSITSLGVTGTFRGNITALTKQYGCLVKNIFFLSVIIDLKVVPTVRGNTIFANVSEFFPEITIESSEIGPLPVANLIHIVEVVVNQKLIPSMNKIGQKGLEIPSIEGVTLVAPSITLTDGAIKVTSDAAYNAIRAR